MQQDNYQIKENIKELHDITNTIELVDSLIFYAYMRKASDIHIDPVDNGVVIRFRVDGVLVYIDTVNIEIHQELIARIKIISSLRTDIHYVPQDGRFNFEKGACICDVRVSILPTHYGENAVLRILIPQDKMPSLIDLGFSEHDNKRIFESINKHQGMILVTGPTGSGKTSTLYTLIKHLAKDNVSIITLEDPIEYAMPKVRQINIREHHYVDQGNHPRSACRPRRHKRAGRFHRRRPRGRSLPSLRVPKLLAYGSEGDAAGSATENVTQELYVVQKQNKLALLENILKEYKGSVLVFSRTKFGAKKIAATVRKMGHNSAEIHSNRSLNQRLEALQGFKIGKYRVLVATDIAARGIDVTGIELVINFDLPENAEDYVHRIGRTGRASHKGHAISFATPDQKFDVRTIERLIKKQLPLAALPDLPPTRAFDAPIREDNFQRPRGRNNFHRSPRHPFKNFNNKHRQQKNHQHDDFTKSQERGESGKGYFIQKPPRPGKFGNHRSPKRYR
jgi:DNA polymerase III delta prime subunit